MGRSKQVIAVILSLLVALSMATAADARKKKVKFTQVSYASNTTWTQNATGPDTFTGFFTTTDLRCVAGKEARLQSFPTDTASTADGPKTLKTITGPDSSFTFTFEPQKGFTYTVGIPSSQLRISKRRVLVCQKAREVGSQIAIP